MIFSVCRGPCHRVVGPGRRGRGACRGVVGPGRRGRGACQKAVVPGEAPAAALLRPGCRWARRARAASLLRGPCRCARRARGASLLRGPCRWARRARGASLLRGPCRWARRSRGASLLRGPCRCARRSRGASLLRRNNLRRALRTNAITCDARTRKPPGVDWKETKRHLLSPAKSRSSLDEPVGAPWACNGGQSCERANKFLWSSAFPAPAPVLPKKKEKNGWQ